MLRNIFPDTPTVGSNENNTQPMARDFTAHAQNLEQRMQNLEQKFADSRQQRHEEQQYYEEHRRYDERQEEMPRRKKITLGKIMKFFTSVIKPILLFIPDLINALTNFKKAAHA